MCLVLAAMLEDSHAISLSSTLSSELWPCVDGEHNLAAATRTAQGAGALCRANKSYFASCSNCCCQDQLCLCLATFRQCLVQQA
jgi:hypothetical protein